MTTEPGRARVSLFRGEGWPGRPGQPAWPTPEPAELEAELRLRLGPASLVAAGPAAEDPRRGPRVYEVRLDPALTAIALLRAVVRRLEQLAPELEIRIDVELQTAGGKEYAAGLTRPRD